MESKKGLEMGFAWIFAILVGIVILFLAIYGATRFIDISETEVTTKTSKALLNVIDEIQTTVQQASSERVPLAVETRIFTSCNTRGDFGNSVVEISERIGLGNQWSKKGGDVSSKNAYLFSEDTIEGKEIYFLIFQFNLPFKGGDITTMHSSPYCFVNAPVNIKNEIRNLAGNNPNLITSANIGSCIPESKTVCFNSFSNDCDIEIQCSGNCDSGIVKKQGRNLFFTQKLLYGAIFASKENYECNVQRLVTRTAYLGEIYVKKAQLVSTKGCDTGLRGELISLINAADSYERVENLAILEDLAKDIERKNGDLGCQLY